MSVGELQRAIRRMPDEATVPVSWVREQLELAAEDDGRLRDFTIAEVGDILERSASTVRGYIRDGRLDAYMFGRAYMVTPAGLRKFRSDLRDGRSVAPTSNSDEPVDLGAWRDELPGAA